MSATPKLESGCQDRVEVSATGGEGSTHHGGGNEAVNGGGVLGLLHADQPGADPADPGGHTLNDGTMEHWHGQVGSAHIVDGGVSSANMGLGNFNAPEDLDESEHGHASNDLGNSPHNGLLLGHGALHT